METLDTETYRYEGLRAYLAGLPGEQFSIDLSFDRIQELIGRVLPAEAAKFVWWSNYDGGPPSPLCRAIGQAEFGVLLMSGSPTTSGFVSFGRGLHRWSGIFVSSNDFGRLGFSERLRQLAYGYLQSAKVLCVNLGDNPDQLGWPRATVVWYCCRHAVELFYKSCISYRGQVTKLDHDIGNLRTQFRTLYPEPEYDFRTVFDGAFVENEDQVLRYYSDRKGKM